MKSLKNLTAKIASRGPIAVVLSVVVSVLFITGLVQAATTISTNIVTEGTLSVTGISTLTGDVTMSGGDGALTLTTTNSATSTIAVGCVGTYATSTDTAIHLTFATAQLATTTSQGGTGDTTGTYGGLVAWRYGACPI